MTTEEKLEVILSALDVERRKHVEEMLEVFDRRPTWFDRSIPANDRSRNEVIDLLYNWLMRDGNTVRRHPGAVRLH